MVCLKPYLRRPKQTIKLNINQPEKVSSPRSRAFELLPRPEYSTDHNGPYALKDNQPESIYFRERDPGLYCRSSIHFRISDRMNRTFDCILTYGKSPFCT